MQGTMPGVRRPGRPRTAWMDNIKTWTVNQDDRGQGQMEKVRPWCGQPSDRGRLKNRTEQLYVGGLDRRGGRIRRWVSD